MLKYILKTKTSNRSNLVTNSIKIVKMVYIKIFLIKLFKIWALFLVLYNISLWLIILYTVVGTS